jgi:hypothetical protein
MHRQPRKPFRQIRRQPLEHRTLAVGVKDAHDGDARACGLERIVVTHLPGEIQVNFLGNGLVEQVSARAGADGRARNVATRWTRDEKMIDSQLALDAIEDLLAWRRRHRADSADA